MREADADAPVTIVDRVTLPRGEAAAWAARLHDEYRPGAEARGYTLAGLWETRADHAHAVTVVVAWRLADVRSFWRSRAGAHDPAVASWWAETDAIALDRRRSVLGSR